MLNGDRVIIDRAVEPHDGSIVVAWWDGGFTMKFLDLTHKDEGYIELRPANPNYPVFKVNDPTSLASKIDYWIEHDEARKQAEISYQKYAQQFRLENCMRQMEQMIINCARQCATERYMSC